MRLRDYQTRAIDAVLADWDAGIAETLLVMATGLGKTNTFLKLLMRELDDRPGARALVLAHRTELIDQPLERLRLIDPAWLMGGPLERPRVGVIQAERRDMDRQLTIATVQSLNAKRTGALLAHGPITHLVVDECFPAGTRVDGRPIETLRPGDLVRSYNHETQAIELRPVIRLFRSPARSLVRVTLDNGVSVVCTPGHPFYAVSASGAGYTPAACLEAGSAVRFTKEEGHGDQAESMRRMRHSVPASQLEPEHDPVLFRGVQGCATGSTNEGCHTSMHGVRRPGGLQGQARDGDGAARAGVLFRGLQSNLSEPAELRTHGAYEPQACVRAHEAQQSDAPERSAPADGRDAASDAPWAQSARGQWSTVARAAAATGARPRLADRGYHQNQGAKVQYGAAAMSLQVGHSAPGIEDRDRSGWRVASGDRTAAAGCEEASMADWPRVASVEVCQPGCDGGFDGLCPDRHVYNIEVEGNHNYFAEGILVHNCHHATAPSYLRIREQLLEANLDLRHLGVTATPLRSDGDGLARVYQKTSAVVSIADGVRRHFLVQPRWLAISTGISISGIHTRGGDYVASELAEAFDTPAGRRIIVGAYQQYASGRRAIAFTASVAGAHDLAEAFRAAGVTAAAVDGTTPKEERARILGDFRAGAIQIVANCQVLTEGFDAPGTNCILMCRPTRSDGLYVQMMGRGLRPANNMALEGEDCLILDFVPEETRNIVMAGDVLGLPNEQARAVRELLKETEAEEGEAQLGFTFDGEHFDTSGTPLEIVARQLDYLTMSTLAWFPPNGTRAEGEALTIGLGEGSDGVDRILAIRDGCLYGIWRRRAPDGRPGSWQVRRLDCGDPYEEAERVAERHGAAALMRKAAGWRGGAITEGQERYLRSLARGRLSIGEIRQLGKGSAAQWISHLQATDALERFCDRSHELTEEAAQP